MYGRVYSAGRAGMEGFLVEVEVDIREGLPCMDLVGALKGEVKEARERVKAALHHCGISLPPKRITVNLSPAGRRKEGGGFDLPVAAAILSALGCLPQTDSPYSGQEGERESGLFFENVLLLGELGLDGSLRPVNGILPLTYFAREQGFSYCLVAEENAPEGCLVDGIRILAISHLSELWELVRSPERFLCSRRSEGIGGKSGCQKDFSDLSGQETLRRAAEVAAAGMHNLLIVGPPGAGKTMAAERLPGILPELSWEEKLELTKIYSICGRLKRDTPLVEERPFRAVHHTIPAAAMMGGGRVPEPGEISLAHKGVLFLDELPEFQRRVLEVLRQPMEGGEIVISRVYGAYRFPADFMVVAGMNIATTKLIQWETAEKPENKAFRGFCGFIFSLFEPFFC
ncbi:MAG: YifB family Mg chelatase-like AAA ATPase [Lachnospiraceae bacterium]|nr:YifB family Mg chelatase-like AAA ATPase [Lachnospiraceae bacterium]